MTDAFARRFWPDADPIGRTFQITADKPEPGRQVIGVVGDIRRSPRHVPSPDDSEFMYYLPREPPAPAAAAPTAPPGPRQVYTGGGLLYIDFTVRLAPGASLQTAVDAAQAGASHWRAITRSVEDAYAAMFSDVTLSARLVGVFAVVALTVAIAGVYGLMTFVVAGRTREIGIRMALGADRRRIARLVLGSTCVATALGVVIGLALSAATSRWIEAQLFAVTRTEPSVYISVAALVAGATLLATWRPARQAARVDPAITLRAE